MRKILLFVAVLLLIAVPAMAAPSRVTITCVPDNAEHTVTVSYDSDANRIRAFGLNITTDTNNIIQVDVCDTNYRIYPGQIVFNTDGEITDYNTPYAPSDLGDANLTIEMGSLYTMDPCYASDPNAGYNMRPGTSGTLLKFYVGGDCNYVVDVNVLRGGIVMEDAFEEPNIDSPLCSGHVGGQQLCTVPPIVGLSSDDANAAIIAANLTVGTRTGVLSCSPLKEVLSQDPANGTEVACESAVNYTYSLYKTTVPDVTNMTPDNAKAALIAAGLTVDGNTCTSSCGSVGDGNVVSTTPAAGSVVDCGTSVSKAICECYCGQADYTEWVAAGKPKCWCYPRQCHGDATGTKEGSVPLGYWYVGQGDLDVMAIGWLIKDPTKGPGILNLYKEPEHIPAACADFKHNKEGSVPLGYWRIGQSDLDEMAKYWLVKEPTKGPGTPANCAPGNRNP